ncbi:hypothetical protein COS91_01805 [Candidatus Desantisbacteria bacterium CG07_land_8_20_14_0_80_39_15]|uniref:Phosphoglucosamine mutase n=1 Tax=Candidatus Desantisbacteria bacterium CG07_land_8_20_14_0_80_39_15 TaxID=1974549 RepID=A0A2M6ZHT6_9BACT|nr:MAG: hypothetical protein COS91_01805 [Candidatus Desantisbacteria bacterium CG07_land_8_20_14_0_80_39_15]
MEKLICSVSGIRGKVGKTLTFSEAYKTTLYFYKEYLKEKRYCGEIKIILGKDDKKSGNALILGIKEAIEDIIKRKGAKIKLIYLGVTSTPMIEWAIKNYKAAGGINITASHNPVEWNGIKLFGRDGMLLGKKEMEKINDRLARADFPELPRTDLVQQYNEYTITRVKDAIDLVSGKKGKGEEIFAEIRKHNYRVVIDACSKETAKIPWQFLIHLGLKKKNILVINSSSIENSQRRLEPAPPYLGNLKKAIKKTGADIGFAFDPDQDRLVVMPLVSEEHTLLLCGKFLLELQRYNSNKYIKNIPVNLSTSSAWDDIASDYGIHIIRTGIGEVNVVKAMQENNSLFGGEGNGGVILGNVTYCRNSTVGMALILAYLAWTGKKIKELEMELPEYVLIKSKLKISPGENQEKNMDKVISRINGSVKDVNKIDGYKIFFRDDSWVQLRPSNTEPIIRIFAEAKVYKSRKKTEKKVKKTIETISNTLEGGGKCPMK